MSLILNFYNFYLLAFFADASISVLDIVLRSGLSVDALYGPRVFVAGMVIITSAFAYMGMGLVASLPKKIIFVPAAFPLVAVLTFGLFGTNSNHLLLQSLAAILQLILILKVFLSINKLNNGTSYLIVGEKLEGAGFRWKNSLVFYGLNLVCLPPVALITCFLAIATNIEASSKGYVSIGSDGLYSTERFFARDGVELRLLGMAHIGESAFYDQIKNSFQGAPALMLMEGVTDEKDLLQTPPDYSFISENLGLDNQRDKFAQEDMPSMVDIVRADLDVADFASGTVEVLNLTGHLYSKEGFSFSTVLAIQEHFVIPGNSENFFKDLLTKRNDCLIGHIQENLEKYKLIIVPWGAMHLPEIQAWVEKNGFVLKHESRRKVFAYSSFFNKLFGWKASEVATSTD